MLTGKTISITAATVINDEQIATHGAIIKTETGDISFFSNLVNKEACKENRDIVRIDKAEFEDFAYSLQEKIQAN